LNLKFLNELAASNDRNFKFTALADRFHETNRFGRMELKPTDLILRRREAPSRRMAAGSVSLVAVLRDARKSALLRTRLIDASI
jgi:hypothetical protein